METNCICQGRLCLNDMGTQIYAKLPHRGLLQNMKLGTNIGKCAYLDLLANSRLLSISRTSAVIIVWSDCPWKTCSANSQLLYVICSTQARMPPASWNTSNSLENKSAFAASQICVVPIPNSHCKELHVHDYKFLYHSPMFGFSLPTAAEPTQWPNAGWSVSKGLALSGAGTLGLSHLGALIQGGMCRHQSQNLSPGPAPLPRQHSKTRVLLPTPCSGVSTRQPGGVGQCMHPCPPWHSCTVLRRKCKAGDSETAVETSC